MARLRASWRTSLPVVQQPRNPQSESIARTPYQASAWRSTLAFAPDKVEHMDRLVVRQISERTNPFLGGVNVGHGGVAAERAGEETDMAPANVWHWSRLPSRRSSPRRPARKPESAYALRFG